MSNRSRRGGILSVLIVGLLVVVVCAMAAAFYLASRVRVEKRETGKGEQVRIQTPFGDMSVDTDENLRPESIGVPVYPGAVREHGDSGGVLLNFSNANADKRFSAATASYSTSDSAEQVTEFYRTRLSGWSVSQKFGNRTKIEFSEAGHHRVVAIHEKDGRTRFTIASAGEPAAN